MYTLGIDIGTSGCKSIIVNEKGEVIASTVEEYPLYNPRAGWSEQEPEDWWKATVKGVNGVLSKSGIKPDEIKGIGLSAQMHGLVAMDKDNNVVRPAILWNDQRTAKQCDEIFNAVGGLDELLKYTNNTMLPGYTAGKILWLREEEPENYEKSKIFLNPKDYLRFRLTGEFATEVSDASGTGLFDVEKRVWSKSLLDVLKIPIDKLPKCYESPEISGKICDIASKETGLVKGTPVAGGGGDAVVQTTGTGLIKEGILGTTIGTAGIVAMGLEGYRFNSTGKLQFFCNNEPGKWHIMGVSLCAGGSNQWYTKHFCDYEREIAKRENKSVYAIIEGPEADVPAGSKGLIFMPYLIGERCPHTDPNARGAFVGLTLRHTKSDTIRALHEGVIFNMKQMYEMILELDSNLAVKEIRTSGGGSASPLWRQIHADIFQLPVKTVSGSAEGGAYGAALVAGAGIGMWSNLEEATNNLIVETETLPNKNNANVYNELYGVFKDLYVSLKGNFERLTEIDNKYF